MAFVDLKPYFQARMKVVDPDLREWEDSFSIENIPAQIVDKAWHIRVEPTSYIGTAHECMNFSAPVTLRVCLKGYKYPYEAIDSAHVLADAIIKECCKASNRLSQANIKNVLPNLVSVREIGQSNDNIVVLEISLNCQIILCP